jgi:predicted PurR-regulated permease PerM
VDRANDLAGRARELPYVGERVAEIDQEALKELLRENVPSAGQVAQGAMGFIGGVFGVFGTVLNLLLLLIISIYLLLDRERITRAALGAIPDTVRDHTVELLHSVEETLVKYLKGQLALCALMGFIGWAIAFFTIGHYALVIGLWVALTEIIPVLGAFLGAVPAVLIALFIDDGGVMTALLVAALFLIAQQIEGNLLVPRIMGGSVGVHPLWVLFATLAATALYGIIGAIFAVPVVAIVAATLRYLRGSLIFERWGKAPLAPAEASSPPPAMVGPGPARGGAQAQAPDKGTKE